MDLNQATWARIGKTVIFCGSAVALILGVLQIVDRFSGPRLIAIISVAEQYISPEVREEIVKGISPDSITKLIDAEVKRHKSPQQILDSVRERVTEKDFSSTMFDLRYSMPQSVVTIQIQNRSDDLAET